MVLFEIREHDTSNCFSPDCFDYTGSFVFPQILELFVLVLWKISLIFWQECTGSVDFLYNVICEQRQFYYFLCNLNSFLCLIAMATTSNTMLNKSDESGYLCLVPDLGESPFQAFRHWAKRTKGNHNIIYDVSCGLVVYDFYYVEVCSFLTTLLRGFITNIRWILTIAFPAPTVMII